MPVIQAINAAHAAVRRNLEWSSSASDHSDAVDAQRPELAAVIIMAKQSREKFINSGVGILNRLKMKARMDLRHYLLRL